jgi:hypothetical protein
MSESGASNRLTVVGIGVLAVLAAVVAVQSPGATRGSGGAPGAVASTPRSSNGLAGPKPSPLTRPSSLTNERGIPDSPSEAIGGLLDARAQALIKGDRAAWLAGLDPKDERFRTRQGQVFDRVATLHPARWSYRVGEGAALTAKRRKALGGLAWRADVRLEYQLRSGGPRVHRQQFLTVVRRGERWLIAGDTDGRTGRDVWDLGPIAHSTSSRCLVVGSRARRAQIRQLARECPRSARTVDKAWGTTWPRRSVIIVPNTLSQLAVLLGRSDAKGSDESDGLERTAAVTIGPADAAADEVVVNGAAFDQLSSLGRQVVLTHELVHVATRATGSHSPPIWLAEGYADHVAYADTGLTAAQIAAEAMAAVRAGRLPDTLPGNDEFDAAGDKAAQAYGESWVAVGAIAKRVKGAAGLKTFYQRASAPDAGSAGLDAALDAALAGARLSDRDALIKVWQARLIDLAT